MTRDFYLQLLIIFISASLNVLAHTNYREHETTSNINPDDTANPNEFSSSNSSCDAGSSKTKMANSGVKKTPAMELCEEFFQWRLKESPEFATMVGVHDYDDRLDSWSQKAFAKRLHDIKEFLAKVNNLLKTSLADNDKLNLQLLKDDLELVIEGMKYKGYVYPLNFLEGVQVEFDRTISWMQYKCELDYHKLLSRYRAFPTQADELIAIMQLGIEEKRVPHLKSMDGVLKQFSLLQVPPEESAFYSPFKSMPDNISPDQKEKLEAEGKECIQAILLPAFKKIEDFIKEVYMKALRTDIAASSLPDGKNYYQQCLRYHLSLSLTPQEVHDRGLQEVERIRKSMEKIKTEVGFNGTLDEFFVHLRNSTEFYFTKQEDLMDAYNDLEFNQITPKLLSIFPHIPKMKLTLEEIPPAKANFPAAYYLAGSFDGSRPGIFYVNTHFLDQRPKYEMASLALHEGLPGHHFQNAYSSEEEGLPKFRQHIEDRRYSEMPSHFPMNTAYLEGWGLYSEYLGEEMGIYKDPYSLFGRYSQEIFRACRLVVDTGMHAMGWFFEQAVIYMSQNCASSLENIETEVRRYITWPGQACSYKIGEMRIKELRKMANDSLGDKFDVKNFHDVVLKHGALPLTILAETVQDYINQNH